MSAAKELTVESSYVCKKIYWKVPNCSKSSFKSYKPGDSIKSDTFTVSYNNASTTWYLELYPNYYDEALESSVFLELHSPSAKEADCINFKVKFKFGVVTKNEGKIFTTSEEERSREQVKKKGFPVQKFVSHAVLFNDCGNVVNDTLTVVAELIVEYGGGNVEHLTESARSSALNVKMKIDFKKMFMSDDFKNDFELKTSDGEVLKAHKAILAARSPVFLAMLKTDTKESKDGSVDVPDFDSTIMKEVLRFIYCNEVEGLEQVAPELIFAAEKYQLEELKNICLQEIISALEQQNVIKSLKIAHQINNADELFEKCLDLIAKNFNEDSPCSIWESLPIKLMAKIIHGMSKRAKHLENLFDIFQ